MNQYSTGTEQRYASCLPPEAYIKICKTVEEGSIPKFRSSVYPIKKTITKIQARTKK